MNKLLSILLMLGSGFFSYSQDVIYPNSPSYHFELENFEATYSQMGASLHVAASTSPDGKLYNIKMSMPDLLNPSRIITDIIGISAEDGSFIYRDFHLPLPTYTYNRVSYAQGKLSSRTFSEKTMVSDTIESSNPLFDGTFAFWQLGGMKTGEATSDLWASGLAEVSEQEG